MHEFQYNSRIFEKMDLNMNTWDKSLLRVRLSATVLSSIAK